MAVFSVRTGLWKMVEGFQFAVGEGRYGTHLKGVRVKNIKAKCNPKRKENRAFSFATLGQLWVRADMGRISKAFSTGPKNIRAK